MPPIHSTLLPSDQVSWWRTLFVSHPGREKRDPQAFAGNGKTVGKALVCCSECLDVEVDKALLLLQHGLRAYMFNRTIVYEIGALWSATQHRQRSYGCFC